MRALVAGYLLKEYFLEATTSQTQGGGNCVRKRTDITADRG